jgi:hypothetical protein
VTVIMVAPGFGSNSDENSGNGPYYVLILFHKQASEVANRKRFTDECLICASKSYRERCSPGEKRRRPWTLCTVT